MRIVLGLLLMLASPLSAAVDTQTDLQSEPAVPLNQLDPSIGAFIVADGDIAGKGLLRCKATNGTPITAGYDPATETYHSLSATRLVFPAEASIDSQAGKLVISGPVANPTPPPNP